eukprot:5609460-Prymnesium_polylepis.1
MKLHRRRSRVSRGMLPAPCRCAPHAERPKIFAGPHVWLACHMCILSKSKTRLCLMGPDQDPRDVKRVTGA